MFVLSLVVMLKKVYVLHPLCCCCSLFFHSCVTAACSSTVLSDISDGLCGMSHPISLQFCPEIGLNCDSINLFLLGDSFLAP